MLAGGDGVAGEVGGHGQSQGGIWAISRDRNQFEHTFVHVFAQLDSGGNARGDGGLGDDAGNEDRQVAGLAAGDRARRT